MSTTMKTYAWSILIVYAYLGEYHGSDGLSIFGTNIHTRIRTSTQMHKNLQEKATPTQGAENIKSTLMIGSAFAAAMTVSASVFQPTIAIAAGDPLETATIDMADATYPVLTSLGDISTLTNKLVKVSNNIPAAKASSALDKGIDSFLAIPDEGVATFVSKLNAAYEGVSVSTTDNSCSSASIPVPMAPIEKWISSDAVQALDSTKVKALQDKLRAANEAVPQTLSSSTESSTAYKNICLPATKQGLEVLWIGQTELILNVPRPEARAFASSASTALQSLNGRDILNLYPEAKKVFTSNNTVDKKVLSKFESSAKALEKVIQSDSRFIQRGVKI